MKRARTLALIAVLSLIAIPAIADPLVCDYCKKPLEGKYRIFEGKNLHEKCFLDHFAMRCAVCNKPILDTYTVYQGQNMHDSCYRKKYAKFCSICGEEITGQYYQNDFGDIVHASHIGQYPPCEYCGRLTAETLTGKGTRYPDGREICGICLKSAVTDIKEAHKVLDEDREALRKHGIEIEQEFRLQLVSKTRMAGIGPTSNHDLRGFAELKERSMMLGMVKEQKINIFALSGMPKEVLRGVLAHELMHVWMFTHGPESTDPALAEGSCEYAAYLVMKDRKSDLARYALKEMQERDDPVYGEGYRKVTGFVQSVGEAGWLDYIREFPAPPWH